MRIRWIGLGVLALGLTLVACGSDDSDSDGGGGSSGSGGTAGSAGTAGSGATAGSGGSAGSAGQQGVPLDEVASRLTDVFCGLIDGCFGPLYDESLTGVSCEEQFGATIEDGSLATTETAVDEGRVIYHGDKVEACAAAMEALGCDLLTSRGPDACDEVFEGTVDEGGACTLTAECKGELICKADEACPGVCAQRQPAGEPCTDNDHCVDGLVCGEDSGVCETPSVEGDACGAGNPACLPMFFCLGADEEQSQAGTCVAWDDLLANAEGETCSITEGPWCELGSTCSVTGITGGVTMECVATVESGAACYFGVPSPCPVGEFCNANIDIGQFEGTCTALPGDGEACNTVGFPECAPSLVCDGGTCRAIGRLGDDCTSDLTCASGNCDGGTCAAGTACSAWRD